MARRWSWRAKFGVALALALLANGVLLLREAQKNDGPALARIKSIERRLNPLMLELAATAGLGIARLEHQGRKSGARYATPLAAEPVAGGFLIGLPYGEHSDWAQNLLAAGDGVVERKGVRYRVDHPRIVPATEALPDLSMGFRTFSRLLGIQSFMRLDAEPVLGSNRP